jgi:pullulanase/glycogen debranching enzyme
VATCIAGSSDRNVHRGRLPINGINFVTCQDGFPLNDLVSYDRKHNQPNGEDNRDMLDFTRAMIAFRRRHPTLSRERYLTGEPAQGQGFPDIRWLGIDGRDTDRDDPEARKLVFALAGATVEEPLLHVMLNMGGPVAGPSRRPSNPCH